MTILEAIILGLVQGLTEFIPISSTAHLRVVPALLGWDDPGAAASAVIQLGTLMAVLLYFWRECWALTVAFFRGIVTGKPFADTDSRLAWFIIIGTIPVVIFGLGFKDFIKTGARSLWLISGALIGIALLLLYAEKRCKSWTLKSEREMTLTDAIVIGLGQVLALIPGSSRSGSTIMAGLFRRLTREGAARFSFLLSIPAILGSGLFELVEEWDHLAGVGWTPIIVAVVVSFISGWASIWFLLRYLRSHTTHVFIWYRIALAVVIMGLLTAGVLQPI